VDDRIEDREIGLACIVNRTNQIDTFEAGECIEKIKSRDFSHSRKFSGRDVLFHFLVLRITGVMT
jgi:hypothetical protein